MRDVGKRCVECRRIDYVFVADKTNASRREKAKCRTTEEREADSARSKAWHTANREQSLSCMKNWSIRNWKRKLLGLARRRAETKGWAFNLKESDLVMPDVCPILGVRLCLGRGLEGRECAPSLDRVDSLRGYTADNTQIVSYRANRMKSDITLKEAEMLVTYLQRHAK